MIHYKCLICGIGLTSSESMAGETGTCPNCKSPTWVPKSSGSIESRGGEPAGEPADDQKPTWRSRVLRTLGDERSIRATDDRVCWFCRAPLTSSLHRAHVFLRVKPAGTRRGFSLGPRKEFWFPRCDRCEDMHLRETKVRYAVTIGVFAAACALVGLGFHIGLFDVRRPVIPTLVGMVLGGGVGYWCGRLIAALHAAANGVFPIGFLSVPKKRGTGSNS